ncbi:shikimate dehydrogenase [Rhodococcus rhodochrous J3]|uniref:Shikimate dehydrogenase (NADP(+)) n=2 Tax=Rhodococcus rhodochrous TaxID=1829 RepID=A0A562E2X7_RHORH|nr:shikimate dehydrogenase [Rhodococcus rhodochrous J45]SMG58003.1 shikimate dehydrogenase [Rhodococcus rhodochrous J3]
MSTTASHRIGLVGAGIASSLSPALHEHEAAELGVTDYRYDLLDLDTRAVPVEHTAEFVRAAVHEGYTGLNITHPCKQLVIPALDELSDDARLLGAVNTVVVRDGRLIGHNTDHSGFLAALQRGLPGAALDSVLLVGAGGAGSAVAYALGAAGVNDLTISDVDPARAADVCARVATAFPAVSVEPIAAADLTEALRTSRGVVNATPIGMTGHPGTPFDTAELRSRQWVADIVYRPLRTELLSAATVLGCSVLDGGQMLVAQAADTFALLTGVTPDANRMREHLGELLAQRDLAAATTTTKDIR